jgi:molybdopterin converting factor small subunit
MKITVQLYGHFRKFGDSIALELPPGSRIRDLEHAFMQSITRRDAAFYENSSLRASRFCDHANILPQDYPVSDGGNFAVLPPVSGG